MLGFVFLLVFSAYLTIQMFSADLYGSRDASNIEAALYLSFTACCFVSPAITSKLGTKLTLFLGTLGYLALVAVSLLFFEADCSAAFKSILICGGAVNGAGAALLWTAQGKLILQYSDGNNNGRLFSIFWSIFNCAALLGGGLTFFYFSGRSSENDAANQSCSTAGSTQLYVIFLSILSCAAFFTLVLPLHPLRGSRDSAPLLSSSSYSSSSSSASQDAQKGEEMTLFGEFKQTVKLFKTKRMLNLSLLFLYTGYNQPYQLNTYGNRLLENQTVGLAMIVFYASEIVGGLYVGSMLDSSRGDTEAQRKVSKRCLSLLFLATSASFVLCFFDELPCAWVSGDCVKKINYYEIEAIRPLVTFALWGFSDSQVQVYSYWLLGTQARASCEEARTIGFYKMVQSLGWTLGFFLMSRMEPMLQMACTLACFVAGLGLALRELPHSR